MLLVEKITAVLVVLNKDFLTSALKIWDFARVNLTAIIMDDYGKNFVDIGAK